MKERDTRDPTRRAKRLQVRLRRLKPDDEVNVGPYDIELLDRGLAALIDCYARGKEQRAAIWRLKR